MALFTISGSMIYTFQQNTFRQVGGRSHGGFKDLTLEQKELLEKDPLIKQSGSRLMLGIGSGDDFRKISAEFSYMDPVYQEDTFCIPEQGHTPKEGTKEAACDTRILNFLGIEPEIGTKITFTYTTGESNPQEITDTFLLSGWWEYDPASPTSMVILPHSYVDAILDQYPDTAEGASTPPGKWSLNVFLDSTMHIEEDLNQILQNNGYQSDDPSADNYIKIGVNWAYAGAQLSANIDPELVIGVAIILILIIFTGYLIIYNIFQISVSGDIRFYGLLKTIGTTGRQIRQIIRRQALLLSIAGIPIGLIFGSIAGTLFTPVVISTYNTQKAYPILKPWFFIAAAAFSLATVLLSCKKPGKIAAKVSPIEAVRYTDSPSGRKLRKKGRHGGQPLRMALSNLGRNKKKTVLVVVSMTLAVVLLQSTYILAKGFDLDKYLSSFMVSDFIIGDAAYFHDHFRGSQTSLPEEDIKNIENGGQITESGRIYARMGGTETFVTEDAFRNQFQNQFLSEEDLNHALSISEHDDAGNVSTSIDLYGMEDYPLSLLDVIDGDLSDVFDPDKNAIAAVYLTDDYNNPLESTNYVKTGDTITLRYVSEWAYYDFETGEEIPEEDVETYENAYIERPKTYQDISYQVVACVGVKNPMSYRFFSTCQFVLNAKVLQKDSKSADIMSYLFNTTPETLSSMSDYLADYTTTENPNLDYETKQAFVQEFDEMRNMYLLIGGSLSFVIGLVGILNFFNAILASINSRKREFAMLQSIGMTGKQLKTMLICEGLIYGASAIITSLILTLLLTPVLKNVINDMFWFFTFRFTILPVLIVVPIFALLGILLPNACYRNVSKQTIVERLLSFTG